jgi:hypothetical protein
MECIKDDKKDDKKVDINKKYHCEICNKNYATYKSLWNHNNKFHNGKKTISLNLNIDEHLCKICNKKYATYKTLWYHNKKYHKTKVEKSSYVASSKTNEDIKIKLTELELLKLKEQKEIKKEETKQLELKLKIKESGGKIINNTTNNTTNNNITFNILGKEPVSKLTPKQIKKLAKYKGNPIIFLLEMLNFNKDLPENHLFCTTSLEGKYVTCFNPEENKFEKLNKTEFYSSMLYRSLIKISELINLIEFQDKDNDNLIDDKYRLKLEDQYGVANKSIVDKQANLRYKKDINQLSYNNKQMILDSWKSYLQNVSLDDSNSDSDSDSDSDSSLSSKSSISSL